MKSRSCHNSTKKGFMTFFTVMLWSLIKYHSPPCFPSRSITKTLRPTHSICLALLLNNPWWLFGLPWNESQLKKIYDGKVAYKDRKKLVTLVRLVLLINFYEHRNKQMTNVFDIDCKYIALNIKY